MIELNGTWDTVVMLLVAGAVGLLGGVAAAFIEWRRNCATPTAAGANSCSSSMSAVSCVFLGGIAAIAILYFFPPTQEVVKPVPEGEPTVTTSYDLIKLVAFALIVGSAGAAFLQALQTRTLALANAERTDATKATAAEGLEGMPQQAAKAAEDAVKAASTQVKAALQRTTELAPHQADRIIDELAGAASTNVAESLEPQVEATQRMVAAAASGETASGGGTAAQAA